MEENKYVDIRNTRGEAMRKKWQKIIDDGVDPFDPKHVEKYIDGKILFKTKHCYVFQNDHPYDDIQLQLVIVTNDFYTYDIDLPKEVWLDLQATKRLIHKNYDVPGSGFTMRSGDTSFSGATVKHFHAQVIVPKPGKKVAAWFGSEYLK